MSLPSEQRGQNEEASLLDGYREMAADAAREQEAWEWCEALVSDASLGAEPDDPRSFR